MFLTILLQVVTGDTTAVATDSVTATTKELSLLDLLMKGGWIMLPIGILLFAAIYMFIERYLYIKSASKMDPDFLSKIRDRLRDEDIRGAQEVCQYSKTPIARMIGKGLSRIGSPIRDVESAIENTARVEIYQMEKNLGLLAAIAAIAPMFGFLGTVVGMIKAFFDISISDNISIGVISSGIYTKMVTSASGLIVGVLAHMLHTYLNNMIDRNVNKMEVTAIDFMDILYKPVQVKETVRR
ncbi:MotA/TolQ/ExbB proton channel family protein [Cytophagaceae bacterium DM2B3-1]|uniref:MotA/TolQ/ExbB proton channel family protein n=2 Tax=Xanthocytophaga TaxID=3078918 RepID=A0AAE3QMC5_9BACT|nr:MULTISPECIES: MotA/TolQ/ExbB proton channel family protein [Xanthocytophaga]MDJ1473582.1 MotA/TolQ/ExbB proton channel family protein [Xanthocytophaga flavus]MDJ1479394.1 MotA/TolQ/ExbB proton channel family protein [Xanthocytophaga flavus]MDJ1492739.1 MotA/TolQ/ExbB proton channel family protein [Xanthocytophaga flavus]MDJ1500953.1 MotA/TolQ/ExbB proton channel family protein [Xanthocytophaga agilis]